MAIFITFQPISLDFAWDTNWWISVNIHAKQLRHLGWLILSKYMEFCQSSKSLTKLKKNWKSSKILNFWMNSINFFKNWAPCLGGNPQEALCIVWNQALWCPVTVICVVKSSSHIAAFAETTLLQKIPISCIFSGDLFDMLLPMLSIYQEYVRNHHYCLQVNWSEDIHWNLLCLGFGILHLAVEDWFIYHFFLVGAFCDFATFYVILPFSIHVQRSSKVLVIVWRNLFLLAHTSPVADAGLILVASGNSNRIWKYDAWAT